MFSRIWGKTLFVSDKNRWKLQIFEKISIKTLVKGEKSVYSLTAMKYISWKDKGVIS
jgi:hypothetical protein